MSDPAKLIRECPDCGEQNQSDTCLNCGWVMEPLSRDPVKLIQEVIADLEEDEKGKDFTWSGQIHNLALALDALRWHDAPREEPPDGADVLVLRGAGHYAIDYKVLPPHGGNWSFRDSMFPCKWHLLPEPPEEE